MKRHYSRLLILFIVGALTYLFTLFNVGSRLPFVERLDLDNSAGAARTPKITVIAIWSIKGPSPNYLPYFFQSVEANDQVDLLFVQVDVKGIGCSSYSHAANVHVCILLFFFGWLLV